LTYRLRNRIGNTAKVQPDLQAAGMGAHAPPAFAGACTAGIGSGRGAKGSIVVSAELIACIFNFFASLLWEMLFEIWGQKDPSYVSGRKSFCHVLCMHLLVIP